MGKFALEPLQVLEMDIKFVWGEEHRRHAFILTVIDTFTHVLWGRKTAYSIKQVLVQELWEEVIENHLQPYDCLNRKIDIEIRNDNDSRFAAKKVQHLSPMVFWSQWRMGNVKVIVNKKQRTTKFKLLVPYQQLSGYWSQKVVPCRCKYRQKSLWLY